MNKYSQEYKYKPQLLINCGKRTYSANVIELGKFTVKIMASEHFVDNSPLERLIPLSSITSIGINDFLVKNELEILEENVALLKRWH